MSSAPSTHGHDAPDTHAFTGEPVQVLPADEPPTPGWLPLVGLALFTGAAIVLLVGHSNAEVAGAPAGAEAAPAAIAVTAPARPAAPPQPAMGANPRPTPDPMEQMRRNGAPPRPKGLQPDPRRPAPAR